MSFSISSSNAMSANVNANANKSSLNKSLSSLSSASTVDNSAYNASGLGIADQLSAQVSGLGRAIMNSNESIGLIQVADGALQEYNTILEDVRVLSLQASNGTLIDSNRAVIQNQIDELLQTADSIAKTTTFNDINLLDGTGGSSNDGTFVTQIGANENDSYSLTINDAQTASIISSPIDVSTQAGASASLSVIDDAIKNITDIRADLGASQNTLYSNIKNISTTQINIASAESQIRDIDFAQESANFSKQNILSQVGSFVQSQINVTQANSVSLLK